MKRWAGVLVIAVVLAASAFSAEATEKTGFYLGLGGSYAVEDFDNTEGLDIDNSWGLNVHGGYQFHRNIALEANFDWYDHFDIHTGFPGGNGDVEIWTIMFDGKFMLPLDNKVVPYARIGIGIMDAKVDFGSFGSDRDSDLAFNLGAGIDVFLTDNVSVGLDGKYVWGTGDVDDLNYFVSGVTLACHF